jgi:Transglutaminase-like superfamily/Domain of Unknown Function with PDB structure (DUF3857)
MTMRWMVSVLAMVGMVGAAAHAADTFVKPTPEELAMTSLPGYPGAAAVVLYREEITDDDLHVVQHYDRIKILTKDGEKYANVALPFISTSNEYDPYNRGDDKTLDQIVGRTIHADGTVIPFTGKPYLKVIDKTENMKRQEEVFTLPDVEVGSIIEYRYATRISDDTYEAPDWYIQGELYLKSAHFAWYPTNRQLHDAKGEINSITWFPILPDGAKIERRAQPKVTRPMQGFDLVVKDVPPQVKEEYMPPIASFSYRVLFNYTSEGTVAEWWKDKGKDWSKQMDSFADPNSELKAATQTVIAGAATQDEKLKKIYATVMTLDNTHYTREHEQREDKAEGEGKVKSAADVLSHKRGNETQLAELFVGMARAAGMKAYSMLVPDRSKQLFAEGWLNFQQFDDVVAIVNVDGKEVFFDPGCRYCAYGHLAWQHTFVQGLRQTDKGTDFATTSGDGYKANRTTRVANLNMDEKGQITGTIELTFMGSAAVGWRHAALRGDEESLKHGLREHLEGMVPKTLDVKVDTIENLQDYEQPLIVKYQVHGTMGTATGKRLIMPSDLFEAGASATFSDEKRVQAVYFSYPQSIQDALRINFQKGFNVEAVPAEGTFNLPKQEVYSLSVTSDTTSFTTRRSRAQSEFFVLSKDYDELRKFYSQFESKDQESVVLKVAPVTTAAAAPAQN